MRAGSIFEIWSAKRVHQSDWKNEGVPFYRTREIVKLAETGTVENDLFISNELFHKLSVGGLPHAGDLMITAVGTIGKVYIVRQEDRFYFKDASVISFRNYGGLEPNFLKSLISSSCVQNQIFSKSAGTTVDTITIVKANDYLLPIPPIEEQKRINKALTQREQQLIAILNSRKRYRRILSETPTSLRQQLIQAAIQGLLVPQNPHDEPARLLLERIAQERTAKLGKKAAKSMSRIVRRGSKTYVEITSDGMEKDISEDIPFEIPDSWEWVRLASLCKSIHAGGDKPNHVSKIATEKYSIPIFANGEKDKGLYGFTNEPRVTEPSITVSARGTIGFSCIRKVPFFPIVRLIVLVPSAELSIEYLQLVLEGCRESSTGTSIPQLTVPMISLKFIPVPPTNEQFRICEKLENLISIIDE